MTGDRRVVRSTTPHLHRRNGIFHLRVRVPDVIRRKLGMCEVHRSLKTYDKARARLLAAVLVPQVHEVFRMAATTTMDRVQLTALLHSHFEQLANKVDGGFVPQSNQPDLEIAEQRELSVARINALRGQIAYNTYDAQTQSAAARLIGSDVSRLSELPLTDRTDLCQGVARAEVEQLGILLHRLADRLTPYTPADPLFAKLGPATAIASLPASVALPPGPSLKCVVEDHLQSGKGRWTQKTYEGKRTKLGYLVEHIGAETPVSAITPDIIRSYKAAILRLRSNHHAGKAKSFAEKQTPVRRQII